jgi:SAM-dependent methyltransferase
MGQRYDEFADWYDAYVTSGVGQPFARSADRLLERLLGPGHDRLCLDLGCGGGAHVPALTRLGWRVTGVDISPRQVDLARRTGITATVANADNLPLANQSVDAVATIMTTTDFDNLPSVFAEAHRVLRPGGRLVVIAAHPCFGGVFVERDSHGSCIMRPGYRRHERIEEHPLLGDGIRARVGVINLPLPALLNALTGAGLILHETAEDDSDQPIPTLLGMTAMAVLPGGSRRCSGTAVRSDESAAIRESTQAEPEVPAGRHLRRTRCLL